MDTKQYEEEYAVEQFATEIGKAVADILNAGHGWNWEDKNVPSSLFFDSLPHIAGSMGQAIAKKVGHAGSRISPEGAITGEFVKMVRAYAIGVKAGLEKTAARDKLNGKTPRDIDLESFTFKSLLAKALTEKL